MKVISRESIDVEEYKEIFEKEKHHDHEIIEDKHGTLRWKESPVVDFLVDTGDLNDIVMNLYSKGHDKNSELYRQLYRDMGYSLYGYWEIFYWEVNNEDADEYCFKPQ